LVFAPLPLTVDLAFALTPLTDHLVTGRPLAFRARNLFVQWDGPTAWNDHPVKRMTIGRLSNGHGTGRRHEWGMQLLDLL